MFVTCKLGRQPNLGCSRRGFLSPLVCALLLFVLGSLIGRAAAAEAGNATAAPVSSGPQLVISDFDGDLQPDLVSVRAGTTISGSTDYWIQFQLSATGHQSMRLVAPAGGVLIEARDVNGDHSVDLVLFTSLRQPIAVFLNNGHGVFSRVEPSGFPDVFSNPFTKLASDSNQEKDALGVPPQSRSGICRPARALTNIHSRPDSIPLSRTKSAFDSFLVFHAGRAPPA